MLVQMETQKIFSSITLITSKAGVLFTNCLLETLQVKMVSFFFFLYTKSSLLPKIQPNMQFLGIYYLTPQKETTVQTALRTDFRYWNPYTGFEWFFLPICHPILLHNIRAVSFIYWNPQSFSMSLTHGRHLINLYKVKLWPSPEYVTYIHNRK